MPARPRFITKLSNNNAMHRKGIRVMNYVNEMQEATLHVVVTRIQLRNNANRMQNQINRARTEPQLRNASADHRINNMTSF